MVVSATASHALLLVERGFIGVREARVAHALGWFGIGLGVAQRLAPRSIPAPAGAVPSHGCGSRCARPVASGAGGLPDGCGTGARFVITHHLPLDEGPQAYRMFRDKQDGCIKVVMHP